MTYGLSTRFHCPGRHLDPLADPGDGPYKPRMRLVLALALLAPFCLAIAGCGGDNLALCNGCSTPVPSVTLTPTPTPTST